MKQRKLQKLELPREVYRYKDADQQIVDEQESITPVLRLDWTNNILLHLEGAEYPQKGLADPKALWLVNLAKRNLVELSKILTNKYFAVGYAILAVLPFKKKIAFLGKILTSYTDILWKNTSPVILKEQHMTPIAQEVEWFTYTFLVNLGVKTETAERFGEIFGCLIEYDNAYRYRLEDLFSETTKLKILENPRREIKKLIKISADRDSEGVSMKFQRLGKLMSLALLHPRIKKSFVAALSEIDIRKMQLDDADEYWVALRTDYKFMGLTNEERMQTLKGRSKPVMIKRKNI